MEMDAVETSDDGMDAAAGAEVETPMEGEEMDETEDMEEGMHDDDKNEGMHGDDVEEGEHSDMDEDLELESIIKELEEELDEELDSSDIGAGDNKVADDAKSSHTEDPGEGDLTEEDDKMDEGEDKKMDETDDKMDEDISLDEIIAALKEEEDKEEVKEEKEDDDVKEEKDEDLKEAYNVIKFLKSKLNEVNLLNAKLLFSNKLFRNYPLSESQKMKVIENFDRAANLREVKLIFSTLAESFNTVKTKRSIKESYASKPSTSTAPKKEILSEGNQLAARWKKLANLI
jgi:hypothetical protein